MLLPHLLPHCLLGLVSAAIVPTPPLCAHIEQAPLPAAPASRRPHFVVGDTVYVAVRFLNVRPLPRADGPGNPMLYVGRNMRGTIVALPNRHWAQVVFMREDVGLEGYVSQWYLAKEKPKAGK